MFKTIYQRIVLASFVLMTTVLPLDAQPASSAKRPATVVIRLPERARLVIEGLESKQRGPLRQFETPPLPAGQQFAYNLEARWTEGGKEVVRRRQVLVQAGAKVEIDVTTPDKLAPAPAAAESFRLVPVADVRIEPGGVALFSVRIRRDNLKAPVLVSFKDVPASVDVQQGFIPEGKDVVQLEARAGAQAVAGSYRMKLEASAGALREQAAVALIVEKSTTVVRLLMPPSVTVAPGGKAPVQVTVEGARLDRSFQVTFRDLPPGVKITDLTIQVQATVEASGDAPLGEKTIQVQARSGAARTDVPLTVNVRQPPATPVLHPKETPLRVEKPPVVKNPAPPAPGTAALHLKMPAVLELKPGESKLLPVRVQREGITGPVTFTYPVLPAGMTLEGTMHHSRQKGYLRASAAAGMEPGEKLLKGIATCGSAHAAFTIKVVVIP